MIVALNGKPDGSVDVDKLLLGRTEAGTERSGLSPMIPKTAQLRAASPECPITPLREDRTRNTMIIRLLALAGATVTLSGCAPDDTGDETRPVTVATVAGATCGYWASWEDESRGASCTEGLWCMPETVPEGGTDSFGICIDESTDCSGGGSECPDDWGCVSQPRDSRDVCLEFCATHSDCESPFQVCDYMTPGFGYCRVRPCLDAPDQECPDGTACHRGLCIVG